MTNTSARAVAAVTVLAGAGIAAYFAGNRPPSSAPEDISLEKSQLPPAPEIAPFEELIHVVRAPEVTIWRIDENAAAKGAVGIPDGEPIGVMLAPKRLVPKTKQIEACLETETIGELIKALYDLRRTPVELSPEVESELYRHAVRLDPFNRFIRDIARQPSENVLDLLRENGEFIYRYNDHGDTYDIFCVLGNKPTVVVKQGGQTLALVPTTFDETGAVSFSGPGLFFDGFPKFGTVDGRIGVYQDHLVLDFAIYLNPPKYYPQRVEVWQGIELDNSPPSAMPLIEQLLK